MIKSLIGHIAGPRKSSGEAFAPSNIALCKYWGKRNAELNLPINSSLSVSLGHLGTRTSIRQHEKSDVIFLNGQELDPNAKFTSRLKSYLDLFRPDNTFFFKIDTHNNFPTAAGLASSASGYAAMALALNDFFGWGLDGKTLSILARLGSGSASRSVYNGFVQWFRGDLENGLDSFAERIPLEWPELRLAVVTVSSASKPMGSTEGMKKTVETSTLYKSWPEKAARDIERIRDAISRKDFDQLGATAESNALAMHATMIDTQPSVLYWLPETVATFHKIWQLRSDGLPIYFTIDAGPNVKILFQAMHQSTVLHTFSDAEIIHPF